MNYITNIITYYFISTPIATLISSSIINYIGINVYIAPQLLEITTILITRPVHSILVSYLTFDPKKLLIY
jgi:hypothetical protein